MKKFVMTAVVAGVLAFTAGSANAAYVYSGGLLKVGSTGAQVMALQTCLTDMGVNPGSNIDGKFGPITRSAVMAFQASKNVMVDGIIGPVTGPLYTAACAMEMEEEETSTTPSVSGFDTNEGEEADFSDLDVDDADDDTLEEGADEAEIAEINFELDEGGAVLLERADIILTFTGADDGDEMDAWQVFDNIYLEVDGDVIAELEGDDRDEWSDTSFGDESRLRATGINHVFEADMDHKITVTADIAGSLDLGTDMESEWTLTVDTNSLRFVDEAGITAYLSEEIGAAQTAVFTIEEEGQDDEFDVQSSNDDPESTILKVEDNSSSDEYTVFIFEIDVDEDSEDIDLKNIILDVTVKDTAILTETYDTVIKDAYLLIDGDKFDDLTVSNGGTLTGTLDFDIDREFTVNSGDTVDVELVLEFKSADGVNYTSATTTVYAEVDGGDVSGEGADNLVAGGAVIGDSHTLATTGLVDSYGSKDSDPATLGDDTIALFTFTFDLEAFEDTFYIAEDGSDFGITLTDGTVISTTITDTDADLTTNDSYEILEGESVEFTVQIQAESDALAGIAQSIRATIDDVDYFTDSAMTVAGGTLILGAPDYKSGAVTVIDAA